MKLFMRKPAVRQIKKEKYYKNIKKVIAFSSRIEYNSYCMIKLGDNTTQSFQKYHKTVLKKCGKIRYYVEYVGT